MLEFGRIEFARGGGALAQRLVFDDLVHVGRHSITEWLAGPPCPGFGPAEPPQA
jgi:hypothetical protein